MQVTLYNIYICDPEFHALLIHQEYFYMYKSSIIDIEHYLIILQKLVLQVRKWSP